MRKFSTTRAGASNSRESHNMPRSSDQVSLKGINVLIVTSGHEATDPRIYAKQACSLHRLGAQVTVVGKLEYSNPGEVEVLAVPKPSSRLLRFLWQPWRCLWVARRQRADIIHFHDAEMLVTLLLAKLWWRRSKFVYDVHEDFANLMLIRDWLPSWTKPVVRISISMVEKGLASLADAIVGVTPPLAGKFGHSNSIVAYNYASQEFFDQADQARRQPQNREFDLAHLGTLNRSRAIFLAETLAKFHTLRPSARSIVIGVSPEIEGVMKERIPGGCLLLGKTPYKEIPGLLGKAKVGLDVHPWLGSHLQVALPVKVIEYMAAGCAVVSSAMPVLNQILSDIGAEPDAIAIIEGGSPMDYARAALRMVESIGAGADPGAKLHELARRHLIWEEEALKIAHLYLKLLGIPCAS
jgi:glycosyltransferase involved in cell wall biosynthesis